MYSTTMVMNSDQVNRYGMRFPLATLYSALLQASQGTPMFMSHDMHHPIGWSEALGLAQHAGVAYLVGVAHFPESEQETQALEGNVQAYLARKLGQVDEDAERRLKQAAGEHLREDCEFMSRECATLVQPGIGKALFPHLYPEVENDKRALIPLRQLKPIGPGVFDVADGICVFAHRYLRRSASRWNNLNAPFLERFQNEAQRAGDFDARIALDPDAIGLTDTYRQTIELEYWWGPKFSDDLAEIDTQITRHAATERERQFHRIERTEFWWYDQDELRAFECEEVVNGETPGLEGAERYACRYAHSMVDLDKKVPHHLDGAVRIYDGDQMLRRMDLNMAEAGRHSEYVKLWRVDGSIPVPLWKSLLSDYFGDNYLVSEYLGARPVPNEAAPNVAERTSALPVPLEIPEQTSPALMVSLLPAEAVPAAKVEVRADDHFNHGDGRYAVIDLSALELLKALAAASLSVERPQEFAWAAYEDTHVELPRLRCAADTAPSVCVAVSSWLQARSAVGTAAITGCLDILSAEADGLRLAFMGSPESLVRVFQMLSSAPPETFEDGRKMLEVLQDFATGQPTSQTTPIDRLREDGSFNLGRTFVAGALLQEAPGGYVVALPSAALMELGVKEQVDRGDMSAAAVFTIKAAQCTGCQESYFDCACTTGLRVEQGDYIGAVLTRHPAFPVEQRRR